MKNFKETEACILRGVIGEELLIFIKNHLKHSLERFPHSIGPDGQCRGRVRAKYGDWHIENLSDFLKPKVEEATGLKLHPTYTYFRRYLKGDELPIHTDRESCEISMSVCIVRNNDEPIWALKCIDKQGKQIEALLEEGDAMIYNGINIKHWRDPLKDGTFQLNAFLHYVNADGLYKSFRYDKRLHPYKPRNG